MAESDILYALAEISVALAGFSAIVVLFKRSDSGAWAATDADRFNGMLIHAVAAASFCLLPSAIAVFETNEANVWSIASALLGIQILLHSIAISRLPSTGMRARLALSLGGVVVIIQALNVLSIYFSREFGPYLLGILWHVFHAGGLFVALVWVSSSGRSDA